MLLRILVYTVLGFVLLLLNVWYVRGIKRHFFAQDFLIAPFQVIGTADSEGTRGQALAHMLVARLSEIEREMTNVNDALAGDLPESDQGANLLQDRRTDYTLSLPTKIFKPLNLDVNVGGVELRGVVAWVQRVLAQNRMLQLSVEGGEDSARIGGSWNFTGIDSIWIEIKRDEDEAKLADGEIIDAVAYELAFKAFAKQTPEVGALTTGEFRKLFHALGRLAALNRQVALGRPTEDEYENLLEEIAPLATKAKSWTALGRLTGQLAERAGDRETALGLYQVAAENGPATDELRAKIETLTEDLAEEMQEKYAAQRRPSADQPPEAKPSGPADKIRLLVGVESMSMSRQPVIALAGLAPEAGLFPDGLVTVLGNGAGEGFMSEYTSSVISAVRLVAPDAKFIVSSIPGAAGGTGAFSAGAITQAYFALASEQYDILLIPYGPLDPKTFDPTLTEALAAGAVIVLPAGNNKGQPVPALGRSRLQASTLISAAIDLDGNQAAFTQFNDNSVWAPGVDVPVRISGRRGTERRSGTAYSAAITAGIAARVLAEQPDLDALELVALLRRTAGGPERPVLNLSAALAEILGAAPSR